MSADKPKAQSNWKAKHELPYHLLCDPAAEVR
jgi:peroxiredoxin